MDLVSIYQCMCDRTRLRILHLLLSGPLCVCHFQTVLKEPQVKISKHLRYLREHGLVVTERCGNMMIYRLPDEQPQSLKTNLACLQDCVREEKAFREDSGRLKKLRDSFGPNTPECDRDRAVRCC